MTLQWSVLESLQPRMRENMAYRQSVERTVVFSGRLWHWKRWCDGCCSFYSTEYDKTGGLSQSGREHFFVGEEHTIGHCRCFIEHINLLTRRSGLCSDEALSPWKCQHSRALALALWLSDVLLPALRLSDLRLLALQLSNLLPRARMVIALRLREARQIKNDQARWIYGTFFSTSTKVRVYHPRFCPKFSVAKSQNDFEMPRASYRHKSRSVWVLDSPTGGVWWNIWDIAWSIGIFVSDWSKRFALFQAGKTSPQNWYSTQEITRVPIFFGSLTFAP